jgi:hypothetical protein
VTGKSPDIVSPVTYISPVESTAIPKATLPPVPPRSVEYCKAVALLVLIFERKTSAIALFGTPAGGGIVFDVTGKVGENVSPVRYTRLFESSAIPKPWLGLASEPPRQVEKFGVVGGVAKLITATKADPFALHALFIVTVPGKFVDVVVPTMYALGVESIFMPNAASPYKKTLPGPFVPPKYVE